MDYAAVLAYFSCIVEEKGFANSLEDVLGILEAADNYTRTLAIRKALLE